MLGLPNIWLSWSGRVPPFFVWHLLSLQGMPPKNQQPTKTATLGLDLQQGPCIYMLFSGPCIQASMVKCGSNPQFSHGWNNPPPPQSDVVGDKKVASSLADIGSLPCTDSRCTHGSRLMIHETHGKMEQNDQNHQKL